jgi:hypothetical protein
MNTFWRIEVDVSANQMFSIVNLVAIASWVLLAVAPRRRVIADIVTGLVVPGLLAGLYVVLIATNWSGSDGGFSSLPAVAALFGNPWLLLAGWVHYLAFDLFIGSWEVRDAREHGIPHLLVLPCLALTFMFGPAGWLLYAGVRSWHRTRDGQPLPAAASFTKS